MQGTWLPERKSIKNRNDASALHETMKEAQLSPADLLARELIQNSKDASYSPMFAGDQNHRFSMRFEFRNLTGAELRSVRESLGLTVLNTHLRNSKAHGLRSLQARPVDLSSGADLRLLIASDFGVSGLGGRLEEEDDSAYFRAMMTLGVKRKDSNLSGGSKGFGKSAFIQGSNVGSVFAYSKSISLSGEDTYSFGGVSYQEGYELPGSDGSKVKFGGLATFGNPEDEQEGLLNPFFGEPAIEFARILGLDDRVRDDINSYGTSLILISPNVDAPTLTKAIERNWWPALAIGSLEVDIEDGDESYYPEPLSDPRLLSFTESYKLVIGARPEKTANEELFELQPSSDRALLQLMKDHFDVPASKTRLNLGKLGLRYDESLGSPSDRKLADPDFDLASSVALVRSTGMVIQEMKIRQKKEPIVQGVFVCSPDIEPLLRELEPAAHNYWWPSDDRQKEALRSTSPAVAEVTESMAKRISHNTRTFKAKFGVSEEVKTRRSQLLGRAFGSIFKSSGSGGIGPVDPVAEPVEIHDMTAKPVESSVSGQMRQQISFRVRLGKAFPMEECQAQVELSVSLTESGHLSGDHLDFVWKEIPEGFQADGASMRMIGQIKKAKFSRFVAETMDYRPASIKPSIAVRTPKQKVSVGETDNG